ncbi:MAG TPA: hypothetical protein VLE96_02345 [Chlamydiales bacterium]|nr:hypothetical protein [Chlamydiales bacterium]
MTVNTVYSITTHAYEESLPHAFIQPTQRNQNNFTHVNTARQVDTLDRTNVFPLNRRSHSQNSFSRNILDSSQSFDQKRKYFKPKQKTANTIQKHPST